MIPNELKELIKSENGRKKLYEKYLPTFELVDKYSDELDGKDLLTEYELKNAQQQLTGAYMKLYIVGDTIDTVKTNSELDFFDTKAKKLTNAKQKITVSQIEKEARANSSIYRDFRNDFIRYATACEKAIITCQSILKKQTNEKGFKGVDHTGEQPQEQSKEW